MAKLIKGKVVIEVKETCDDNVMADVSLTPLDLSDPEDYEDDLDEDELGETDLLPERDGSTFASAIAPWVGAERAWRRESISRPEPGAAKHADGNRERDKTPLELVLSESDMSTVVSIPPRESGAPGSRPLTRLLSYVAVAALSVMLTWYVTGLDDNAADEVDSYETLPISRRVEVADSPAVEAADELGCSGEVGACRMFDGDESMETRSVGTRMLTRDMADEPAASSDSSSPERAEDHDASGKRRRRRRSGRRAAKSSSRVSASPEETVSSTSASVAAEETPVVEPDTPREETTGDKRMGESGEGIVSQKEHRVGPNEIGDEAARVSPTGRERSLPKALVKETMDSVAEAIRRCKADESGRLVMELVVSGTTGRVTSARAIEHEAVGTEAGQCAARVVRQLRFPEFDKSQLTIRYPFDL